MSSQSWNKTDGVFENFNPYSLKKLLEEELAFKTQTLLEVYVLLIFN